MGCTETKISLMTHVFAAEIFATRPCCGVHKSFVFEEPILCSLLCSEHDCFTIRKIFLFFLGTKKYLVILRYSRSFRKLLRIDDNGVRNRNSNTVLQNL